MLGNLDSVNSSSGNKAAGLALAILDQQPFGSLLLDQNQRICFWNTWLNQWTGIDADQAEGKPLDSLFPSLFHTDFLAAMNAALLDHRKTEWSQRLDPERLDDVEAIFTGNSREMPLHSVLFLPVALPDYGQCCLVQISESPFDPLIVRDKPDQAEDQLDSGVSQLPVYLESESEAVFSIDREGLIQSANTAAEKLFDYLAGQLVGKPVRVVLPDFDEYLLLSGFGNVADVGVQLNQVMEGVTLGGETLKLGIHAFRAANGAGALGVLCRDISRETVSHEALFQQRELLNVICEQVADGVVLIDRLGFIERINPVAKGLLGVNDYLVGNVKIEAVMELVSDDGQPLPLPSVQALERGSIASAPGNAAMKKAGGEPLPVMVTAIPMRSRDNRISGCTVVFRATSEARRVSSRLNWQARHDPLTQLANRSQLESELLRAIEQARANHSFHTLLYIDLYNFSVVNDTCGHKAGDELLRRFARMLEKQASPKDIVARIGNDEFAVLINERPIEEARQVAEELLWQVKSFSFPWEERRLKIGVSIGAKVIDQDTVSEIDVLLGAGASCSMAKESGRNRIHFSYQSKDVVRRQSLAGWIPRITEALEEDRFILYSQPIVPVTDSGRIKHSEVLVRMLDTDGGIIPPGKFIPAAEHYGLIEDIDRWVFDKVLEYLQEIQQAGDTKTRLAVNLSGNTISDESLKDYFISRFRETGVDPRSVQFEVTETATISHFDRAMNLIHSLKDEGCYFALDDFGNGLSSLGYLKQLPVDYLKIDGSFIRAMEQSEVDYSMVSTINHLGQIMGIKTIAECVETEAQLSMLKDIGVDYIQGFIADKPKPLVAGV